MTLLYLVAGEEPQAAKCDWDRHPLSMWPCGAPAACTVTVLCANGHGVVSEMPSCARCAVQGMTVPSRCFKCDRTGVNGDAVIVITLGGPGAPALSEAFGAVRTVLDRLRAGQ